MDALSITSDLIRGNTDTIILAQLRLGDSYGYKINKAIQRKTRSQYELKEATLYTAFRITNEGRQALERLKAEWQTAKALIDALITDEEETDHAG